MESWKEFVQDNTMSLVSGGIRVLVVLSALVIAVNCRTYDRTNILKYKPEYTAYHSVDDYNEELTRLAKHPLHNVIFKITEFGKSRQRHAISGIEVVREVSQNSSLPSVLIVAGEHAREFIPVSMALDLVYYILRGVEDASTVGTYDGGKMYNSLREMPVTQEQKDFADLILSNFRLVIIPFLNPDGRRSLQRTGDFCHRGTGNNVDINRNFDWQYGKEGSSANPRSEEYRGTSAFSEPETRLVRDLLLGSQYTALFALHSGIQHIYIPFGDNHSKSQRLKPRYVNEMLSVCEAILHDSEFYTKYGIVYEVNDYPVSGGMADWAAGVANVSYVFTVEVYGSNNEEDDCFPYFNPKDENLAEVLSSARSVFTVGLPKIQKFESATVLEAADASTRARKSSGEGESDEIDTLIKDLDNVMERLDGLERSLEILLSEIQEAT